MITSLLIANRGEIAVRIARTAKRLGIRTVAVYSDADAKALHVRHADEAVRLGPGPATESYLQIDRVIAAAIATGAKAIHPGYGFLSENADFAEAVVAAGLVFVGPTADAMRRLGGKASAKEVAIAAGVPVVPGYQGAAQDIKTLTREAARIGYPVMIKAVAGGGGRGMRLVPDASELQPLLESAQREAAAAFGNDHVLLEKVVVSPRHIEVQVFGDSHGNVVHLFERDCSLQRRNQKVIEEAPAPGMSPELRVAMTAAAVKLARSVGYQGAGTVEFLVEGGTLAPDAPWFFIEMNTRLQVEHPVTEEITGLDLVEWQLRVAGGERLPLAQADIRMTGHAIEARLCAEDPTNGFMPSIGRIVGLHLPSRHDIRYEFGVETGSSVSTFYDSMIGKIIATGSDREQARARLAGALPQVAVYGLKTNAPFLLELLRHPIVVAGMADTGLIGRGLAGVTATADRETSIAAGVAELLRVSGSSGQNPQATRQPWGRQDAFQLGGKRTISRIALADGQQCDVRVTWHADGTQSLSVDGRSIEGTSTLRGSAMVEHGTACVLENLVHTTVAWPTYSLDDLDAADGGAAVRAPISGRLAKVFVAEGEVVEKGARIAVVEAMKMEHVLTAPRAGKVERIAALEGSQVAQHAVIATLADLAT